MMNKKAEADLAENLLYVFVCLAPEGSATFYVVPRKGTAYSSLPPISLSEDISPSAFAQFAERV